MSLDKATELEKSHMAWIKSLPCGVCEQYGPSDAHHITLMGRRISHFLVLPLCAECHRGQGGIHNLKTMWNIYKLNEWQVLADVIARMADRERGL